MRYLMWFTVGFSTAIAVSVYLFSGLWLLIPVGILVLAAGVLALRKSALTKIVAVLTVGFFVGGLWYFAFHALHLGALKEYDGKTISTAAEISDYSYETDYGVAADGNMTVANKTYRVKLYFSVNQSLKPGDTVEGDFRIRLTTKDSIQGETYHQGNGMFLLSYVSEDAKIIACDKTPKRYFPAVLRKNITDTLDTAFPEDTLAFARALLLGDSSLLDYEADTAFKLSGIRHVIAVSGLHVSILFSLVYIVSGKRRLATALLGIPILVLFAAVAGFTPSIVRACIMQSLMILAMVFKKEYDPPTALSFAVLVMLVTNPLTITSVSFQLSVGCLVGILMFYQRSNNYLLRLMKVPKGKTLKGKLCRWFCGSVSITVSAMIMTTPLCAYYFGTISLIGVVTNLLTLWVISCVFYGIMLSCLLGAFCVPAARVMAWIISWPIRYVIGVAKIMARFPFGAVYTCSIYILVWLVLCYALFTLLLRSKQKRPLITIGCALAGLVVALLCSWVEPQLDDCRVTVFDVGQGQSILIQSNGENYLVDCGGDNATAAADLVAQRLQSQGIQKLDGLILTHFDLDHAAGAERLLKRIGADALYLPDITDDHPVRKALAAQYAERIVWVNKDMRVDTPQMQILLYPAEKRNAGNESSLCILFQHEKCDILLTGDLGMPGERALVEKTKLPDLELLVVGHHGSKHSTSLELLVATKPDNAVISVGRDNFHGHPSDEVIHRLQLSGCNIYRTDIHGAVIFRR